MLLGDVEFQIRQSPLKATLGLAGCIAFVAMGWWLQDEPEVKSKLIGWAAIVTFAAFTPSWLAAVFRPATLSVSRSGLAYHSALRSRTFAWSEIQEIEKRKIRGTTIVQLLLNEPHSPLDFLGLGRGKFHLGTAWTISQIELADRLLAARARFATDAPSRPANPIAM